MGSPVHVVGKANEVFVAAVRSRRRGRSCARRPSTALGFDRLRGRSGSIGGSDGQLYAQLRPRDGGAAQRRRAGPWTIDWTTFSRFGREPIGVPLVEADQRGVVRRGTMRSSASTCRSGAAAAAAFPALIRRVTSNQDRVLFAGRCGRRAPRCRPRPARCGSSSPRPASSTRRPPSTSRASTAWTRTGRRGRARPGATTRTSDSATTASASARATSPATGQRGGDLRLHDPARRGTARGGRTARYVLLVGLGVFAVDRFQRCRLIGKERERAQFAEARLRAEAAEALARSESEGKKNVELLSEIGREITASLDFDTIFGRLYERVNELADAEVFGVGLYHPDRHEIEYRLAIETGQALRALLARHDAIATSCPSGASSTASRCSSTTSRRSTASTSAASTRRAASSRTARCRSSRSRSSTCRSSPRSACSASSPSRASGSTPTPSTTST